MDTMLLDQTTWDVCLDANGNIAIASDPYSVAQDVASACKTFQGEVWYNTSDGVPYFQNLLGQRPPISTVKQAFIDAALTVPGCNNPVVYLSDISPSRRITGQIQFTDDNGVTQTVSF